MTLLQLVYFKEVCRTLSFTKAAQNLYVTQPTITNAVKELEAEFHLQLIARNNRSFSLTEDGQALLEMSTHLLEYSDWMKLAMQDRAEADSRLHLGIPSMCGAAFFPRFFNVVHKFWPELEISTTYALSDELLRQLDAGKQNVLIIPYKPTTEYCSMVLHKSQFLFCVSEKHPMASKKTLSFRDICHEPIISYYGDRYLHSIGIAEKYREAGGELRIIYQCRQINILTELIRQNEGCGFMLENSFPKGNGVVGISLQDELSVTMYLVWRKESAQLSCVRKIVSCFKDPI